jgi:hypothetical protein
LGQLLEVYGLYQKAVLKAEKKPFLKRYQKFRKGAMDF